MAAPKDNGGFLQVPTPGGLAPLQKQTLNPVPTGSATGKKKNPQKSLKIKNGSKKFSEAFQKFIYFLA